MDIVFVFRKGITESAYPFSWSRSPHFRQRRLLIRGFLPFFLPFGAGQACSALFLAPVQRILLLAPSAPPSLETAFLVIPFSDTRPQKLSPRRPPPLRFLFSLRRGPTDWRGKRFPFQSIFLPGPRCLNALPLPSFPPSFFPSWRTSVRSDDCIYESAF